MAEIVIFRSTFNRLRPLVITYLSCAIGYSRFKHFDQILPLFRGSEMYKCATQKKRSVSSVLKKVDMLNKGKMLEEGMMSKCTTYIKEFKLEAVHFLEESDLSQINLALGQSIRRIQLYRQQT